MGKVYQFLTVICMPHDSRGVLSFHIFIVIALDYCSSVAERLRHTYFRPYKIVCVFQITWNCKIGRVGLKIFLFR